MSRMSRVWHRFDGVGQPRLLVDDITRDIRGRTTQPQSSSQHLDETIRWLFRSQDVTDGGGSAAVYNLVLGWSGPYPETTGYIIPTLYKYDEYADSPEARRRARRMAEWLCTVQLTDGGFPAGVDPKPDADPSVFNTGQIVLGLARAHEETGDEAYRRAVSRAGRWLVSVQRADGCWDGYDYKDTAHSYASRVAWALLVAGDVTDTDGFRVAAKNNLSWVADQQLDNGWFEHCAFERGGTPFVHTIAYTVRGVLEGAVRSDDRELLDVARTTADRLVEIQRRDGVLFGTYDEHWDPGSFRCLTGNAQMAIVWLRFYELTRESRYRDAAMREIEYLKTRQRLNGPLPARGGLKGSQPVWGRYMYLRYPNWAAKFFADALLTIERDDGRRYIDVGARGRSDE